jgi:hypothetical protein
MGWQDSVSVRFGAYSFLHITVIVFFVSVYGFVTFQYIRFLRFIKNKRKNGINKLLGAIHSTDNLEDMRLISDRPCSDKVGCFKCIVDGKGRSYLSFLDDDVQKDRLKIALDLGFVHRIEKDGKLIIITGKPDKGKFWRFMF